MPADNNVPWRIYRYRHNHGDVHVDGIEPGSRSLKREMDGEAQRSVAIAAFRHFETIVTGVTMVHLHLMASHIPVIGVLLLIPLLLIALVRRSDELSKVGLWGIAGIART